MKILITGGCGFLGSNLAQDALDNGAEVLVFDNLSRLGSIDNLTWLKTLGDFQFINGDIRIRDDVENAIKEFEPEAVFHLAGQVAMTTSLKNPRMDFEVNVLGTINVLESLRMFSPDCKLIYSSTNKVYGDLEQYSYTEQEGRYLCNEYPRGFDEAVPLEFHSPYGCSKGAADQYVLDYSRMFGLDTMVFRHSSMYGGRQFATYDQGWIGWFCGQALMQKKHADYEEFTISGNGKQVRDVLHARDMKSLYRCALASFENASGQAFNIGGGIDNSLSLLELFGLLEKNLGNNLRYREIEPRSSDQRVFVADINKAKKLLGWSPVVDTETGIQDMLKWIEKQG